MVDQRGPVQAVRVPGRVAQLVQRRVRVGRLRLELAPVGQYHAVVLQAVVRPIAGDVVDANSAAADERLGAFVPLPEWCNKAAEVDESAKQGWCEWLLPQ